MKDSRKITQTLSLVAVAMIVYIAIRFLSPSSTVTAAAQPGLQDPGLVTTQAKIDSLSQENVQLKSEKGKLQAQLFASHESNAKLQSTADYWAGQDKEHYSLLTRTQAEYKAEAWRGVAFILGTGLLSILCLIGVVSLIRGNPRPKGQQSRAITPAHNR